MRIAILTISDSVALAEREDLSGPALAARCRGLGWDVNSALRCSDDPEQVRNQIRAIADSGRYGCPPHDAAAQASGPRDNTPEATLDLADRTIPGLAEEIRRAGAEKTPTALLSRGVAIIRNKTIVINLPGAPKAPSNRSNTVAHLLPHAVEVLRGARHD